MIKSSIFPPSGKYTGNMYMEDNNIFEDNALKASSDEDRRDDSNLAEALQRTVNLEDLPPQHLNKGNMLKYSADEERKGDPDVSEAFKQTVNPTDLSLHHLENMGGSIGSVRTRRSIDKIVLEVLSGPSTGNNSRRQSLSTMQKLDVLIVDDSGLSRKMLSRLLSTSGHAYDVAEDGLLALDKVKAKMSFITNGSEKEKGSFDVILMDFVMPNMDGPTATKAIRDMGYTAPIFGKHCIHMLTGVSECIGIGI
jgi:CheY-like chemotaxis protein